LGDGWWWVGQPVAAAWAHEQKASAPAAIRAVMPMSARHLAWAWEGQPDAARLPFLQRPRHVPELEPLEAL
jgi:hypothetical protein